MSLSELVTIVGGAAQAIGVTVVFMLALFIGVCVALNVPKFRQSGPKTLTVRNLDEALGRKAEYLGPGAARGTIDQLAGSRSATVHS